MQNPTKILVCVALLYLFAGCGNDQKQPDNALNTEAKPAEAKPAEAKPAEAKPAEAKPAEAKPAEAQPAEAKPAEAQTVTSQAPVASELSKLPQADTKITESGSSNSESLLLLVTIISLVTTSIAISITFYLYRWRKLLQANPSSMVPEQWGVVLEQHSSVIEQVTNAINQSSDTTVKSTNVFSSNIEQNSQKLEQMISTFVTLQKSLDKKDQEITRLKKGYDNKIFKSCVGRFIRVDQFIRDTLESQELTKKDIENISALMIDALEECNVELFDPQIGKNYRELGDQVADKPKIIKTDDASLDFTIAKVESSGYQLLSEVESQILIPAKVAIYHLEKTQQEES